MVPKPLVKTKRQPSVLTYRPQEARNAPLFDDSGAVGSGYKWSITPALPKFLELVTSATLLSDEGMIRVVKGQKLEKMAKKTYTVTCQLLVDGKPHGLAKTTVDISVVDEKEELESSA